MTRAPVREDRAPASRTAGRADAGNTPSICEARGGPGDPGRSWRPNGCSRGRRRWSRARQATSIARAFGVTADFVERSVIGGRAIVGEVVTSIGSHDNAPQLGEREGLYGPESESWRLNREAMLLLGAGPRSLLMQIAHPLIAEGVDQHSDFRADPWRRLQGTLRSYLRIVFGTTSHARREISRLNGLHRSIKGPVRDAVALSTTRAAGYSARDPRLALWVHATLVDSTIVAYDAWIEPLPRERRARLYTQTRPTGPALG